MFNKIRGPYEKWEVKLLASKYRDFFVISDTHEWVIYKKWNRKMPSILGSISEVEMPPSSVSILICNIKRYFKRRVFWDHH